MTRRGNNEGSIYRRNDGRWAAGVSVDGGRRKPYYGRTRQDVAQKLQKAQRALANGLPLAGDRLTTGALLESWLQNVAAQKVRPKTLRRYREIVQLHLAPEIGRVPLVRLTPQNVEAMLSALLAKGMSPRTASHCRAVLRNALHAAERWGFVGRNVAGLAEPPRVPQREVRPISTAQARALLNAVKGDRLEALFTVALAVGLRQSEALGLRWSDVDLDSATLSVQRGLQRVDGLYVFMEPKTQRSRRTLTLPRPVVAALREHRSRQAAERLLVGTAWQGEKWGHLVFANEAGEPLSGFHASRRFHALLRLAGLPTMRYHDLRHGAASLMAAQGVPARVAMEILGHAEISTTLNIYTHVGSELQKDAAERMAASLWADA